MGFDLLALACGTSRVAAHLQGDDEQLPDAALAGVKWTSIPLGYAIFPQEIERVPRTYVIMMLVASSTNPAADGDGCTRWLHTLGNVVFES